MGRFLLLTLESKAKVLQVEGKSVVTTGNILFQTLNTGVLKESTAILDRSVSLLGSEFIISFVINFCCLPPVMRTTKGYCSDVALKYVIEIETSRK
ncbi:hypothetical protein ACROYT_G018051 [Oculina patagonica]